MKQSIHSSTTNSIQESPNMQIITVMNRAIYGECFSRQPDDTLEMLQENARALGATAVTGVRLVPMVDERGVLVMMAYGTAVMDGVKTIHVISVSGGKDSNE